MNTNYKLSLLLISIYFINTKIDAKDIKSQETTEKYIIKDSETMSEVLHKKGVRGINKLYSEKGYVNKNKDLNPSVNNWKKLKPGQKITIKYKDTENEGTVTEEYTVQDNETMSEILHKKGVRGVKKLYSKDGYVSKNKNLNPNINNWKKLKPGQKITIKYKDTDTNSTLLKTTTKNELLVSEKNKPNNWETRVSSGLSVALQKTAIVGGSLATTNGHRSLGLSVSSYFKKYDPFHFRVLAEIIKPFSIANVIMPLEWNIEFGSNYSITLLTSLVFNPTLSMRLNNFNIPVYSSTQALSARKTQSFSIGFSPELVQKLNKFQIEYIPFVYKTMYSKTEGTQISGWDIGLKTNIAFAYQKRLFAFAMYNYKRYVRVPDLSLKTHSIMLGLTYKL